MTTAADHFNQLDPAEAERLAILQEEMGEAIQVVGKILRHGYHSRNPDMPMAVFNRELLAEELSHVWFAMELMGIAGDINPAIMRSLKIQKACKIGKWTHHQPKELLHKAVEMMRDRP